MNRYSFRYVATAICMSAVGLCVDINHAQDAAITETPKASAEFTFDLNQHDSATSKFIEIMHRQNDERQTLELTALNRSPVTKAIDLLRFIPFRFSTRPDDDFLLPNYLGPRYSEVRLETNLFSTK